MNTPEKTIERLSIYRRLLNGALADGKRNMYSHELAERVGGTAAQVRRDLMGIGCSGNSKTGSDVESLGAAIGEALDNPDGEPVVLMGVGNLGRALLHFFTAHHPKLGIVAAFDNDPRKLGRVIHGCWCYGLDDLEEIVDREHVRVAILALPVTAAQPVAERLAAAGVTGLLNFAPTRLRLPANVAVDSMDMTCALEKVAYLARQVERKEH